MKRTEKVTTFFRAMWSFALILFGPTLMIIGMGIAYQNTRAIGFAEYGEIAEILDTSNGFSLRLFDLQLNLGVPKWLEDLVEIIYLNICPIIRYVFDLLFNIPQYIKILLLEL